jgi:hypothetical protein
MRVFAAHFSQNWGFLCLSPVIAGNIFSLMFGRNLDAHSQTPTDVTSPLGRDAFPPADNNHQCLEGRLCYVDSVQVTIIACMVALGLSIFGGIRDRRKRGPGHSRRATVVWEARDEDS